MRKILYINYVNKEFKQILTEFLKENNLSQSEFARRIGVKAGLVNDWLRCKAKPSYDTLRAMSKAFNISADYFLGLTDEY